MRGGIWPAGRALGGLGAGAGLLLAAADRIFRVEADPRLRRIQAALPGDDCGACGFSTCSAYAAAVLEGTTVIGACPVGGDRTAARIARVMGVECPAPQVRQVALTRCTRDAACSEEPPCIAACRFDAVGMEDGAAQVDPDRCRGCLRCVAACPEGLITVVPYGGGAG